MSFLPLISLGELETKDRHFIKLNDEAVLLIKDDKGWRAFEGRCPHAKAMLTHAEIKEGVLECPFHGWKFSLKKGECVFPEGAPSLVEFELKFEKDDLMIKF